MWGSVTAHQYLMRWGWEQAGRTPLLQRRNGCLRVSSRIVPKPLCVHISVFPSLQRTEQLALSGVGWDLISDAAQPVISAIITSLIQPLLSASPSSLLPSCFPSFLLFPASLCFQILTFVYFTCSHTCCHRFLFYFIVFALLLLPLSSTTSVSFTHVDLKPNEWILLISCALGQCAWRETKWS